jgi:outer membrane protein OmpA-like peptidoglycan-associated protein
MMPVHFARNSSLLDKRELVDLKMNADFLKKNPHVKSIDIEGHTDEGGSSANNLELGLERARHVQRKLEEMGVSPTRLHPFTYGEEMPTGFRQSEASLARDRRVEFKVRQVERNMQCDD